MKELLSITDQSKVEKVRQGDHKIYDDPTLIGYCMEIFDKIREAKEETLMYVVEYRMFRIGF